MSPLFQPEMGARSDRVQGAEMEEVLAELESWRYGGNYQVFLRVYRVAFVQEPTAELLIAQALGPSAVVGRVVPITELRVLTEVEECLRYAGDTGHGPEPIALRSQRFELLVSAVLSELRQSISGATLLTEFGIHDGHPAYPVFWDFAFVIAGSASRFVFIGSSSD